MSWNGAGVFNRIYSWATDALNALAISSSRMDTEFDNYKTGLENCVTRDGQNQASANLPMGTFRHTAVGTASARDQYAQVGQIQDTGYRWGSIAGGTANALTIAVTPAITTYAAGQTFRFVTLLANTAAVTLAVNGLSATAIVKENGAALVSGDLAINTAIEVIYNGTNFRLMRPGVLLSGAALTDVLHTTGNESKSGVLTLTSAPMVSMSSPRVDFKDTSQTLPAGLFAWQTTGGAFRVIRNTAAGGDFSTGTFPINISAADAVTLSAGISAVTGNFTGNVTGIDGTIAAHLATKGQLDAKVYGGQVTNAGTAAIPYGPSGWTVSRNSVGNVTLTHNLGTTNYAIVPSPNSAVFKAIWSSLAANTVQIITYDTANALADTGFNFVLARN